MKKAILLIMTFLLIGALTQIASAKVFWDDEPSYKVQYPGNYALRGYLPDLSGDTPVYFIPDQSSPLYGYYNSGRQYYGNYNKNYYQPRTNYQRNNRTGRGTPTTWGMQDNSIIKWKNQNEKQHQWTQGIPPPSWYKPYVYGPAKPIEYNNQQNKYQQPEIPEYLRTGDMRDYPFPITEEEAERVVREAQK